MTPPHTLALAGALALAPFPAIAGSIFDGLFPPSPPDLVTVARRHVGETARDLGLPRTLWCADFVNLVRREAGLATVPSRLARDQAHGGRRISSPRPGAIVILSRGHGAASGHTGVVSGVTAAGDLIVISGNHNHHVAEAVYPRSRVAALVDPAN